MSASWGVLLVILLGILRSAQTHLAKALERQGIETLAMVGDRLRGRAGAPGLGRKPAIYVLGLVLNHTTFIYHLMVVPLGGTTALYISMYGVGLVVLLIYSTRVMREPISRAEAAGALSIVAGTTVIGIEGIARPPADMAQMALGGTVAAAGILFLLSALLVAAGLRDGSPNAVGFTFGLSAAMVGSLDPLFKAVGQAAGGGRSFLPGSPAGWALVAASFLVGEAAVVITQWAYTRRARSNVLVPAYDCAYIAVPVILQALLMRGYALYLSTYAGLALIMAGIIAMRALKRETLGDPAAAR